ncbi:MAG: hypothetical protein GY824_04505, partial [Delftia sp.]|nr:hypothetical protein [Delftia sp.]
MYSPALHKKLERINMSVNFDWDFEEQDAEPSFQREGIMLPGGRQRNWRLMGVLLFTLLVVGGLSVRLWLNYRLSAIADVEAELRKLVQLELQHITDGDADLLRHMQDPSVFRWQSRQVARYAPDDGGGLAPSTRGFAPAPGLVPADRAPQIHNVRVVGRSGRVELTHWFQSTVKVAAPALPRWLPFALPDSADLPLPFHVTWFYRLDQDGVWYHTAPSDAHVGIPYSWYGTRLDIHATEIEAETLHPVAGDVTMLMLKACRLLGCDEDEHYVLDLDDSPEPRLYSKRWSLPALYLAGLPDNQVAHDAWLQALKLWLVEALARSRAGSGVQERVLYQRLVTRLQAELDLGVAPALDVETLALILNEVKLHSFPSFWDVEYDPEDAEGNRLLEAEIDALLYWVEEQVGTARLFELLPALSDYSQLDHALLALYHQPPATSFEWEWFNHLFELTGVPPLPLSALPISYQALGPPPTLPPSLISPGEQVTFICDGRVWASNADGSNRVPLTVLGEHFGSLYWSPDGRWLLTTWQHGIEPGGSSLYLL